MEIQVYKHYIHLIFQEVCSTLIYKGPKHVAAAVLTLTGVWPHGKILDVAAGTGNVGKLVGIVN